MKAYEQLVYEKKSIRKEPVSWFPYYDKNIRVISIFYAKSRMMWNEQTSLGEVFKQK